MFLIYFLVQSQFFVLSTKDITRDLIGQNVVVKGEVTSLLTSDKGKFFDLKDETGKLKSVVFNDLEDNLEEGKKVILKGEVNEYKGELEIVVREIEEVV